MKALFWLLAAFLIVFFLGCQESSITDPGTIDDNAIAVQNDQNLTDKDMISAYPGVINVFQSIYDPTHPQNGGDLIKGFIRYDHKIIPVYSNPDNPRYTLQVKFYTNLSIFAKCPMHDDCMKVATTDQHNIDFIPTHDNAYWEVEKVYRVSNACCGRMNLVLKFNVERDNLTLVSMSLKKVSGWVQIGDPE